MELTEKKLFLKIIFISISSITLLHNILLSLSIAFYPGGNTKSLTQEGFSLLWNVMCDLGENLALNGEPNQISQILFRISSTLLAVSVIIFFCLIWLFFQDRKKMKILSLIGTSMIIVAGLLFIGVVFIPQIYETAHITLLIIAPFLEVLAILLYTIVFWKDKKFQQINRITFLIMFILAMIYVIGVIVGVAVGGDLDLQVRRAGHTLFTYLLAFGYSILGIGTYLFVKRQAIT